MYRKIVREIMGRDKKAVLEDQTKEVLEKLTKRIKSYKDDSERLKVESMEAYHEGRIQVCESILRHIEFLKIGL